MFFELSQSVFLLLDNADEKVVESCKFTNDVKSLYRKKIE